MRFTGNDSWRVDTGLAILKGVEYLPSEVDVTDNTVSADESVGDVRAVYALVGHALEVRRDEFCLAASEEGIEEGFIDDGITELVLAGLEGGEGVVQVAPGGAPSVDERGPKWAGPGEAGVRLGESRFKGGLFEGFERMDIDQQLFTYTLVKSPIGRR